VKEELKQRYQSLFLLEVHSETKRQSERNQEYNIYHKERAREKENNIAVLAEKHF